MFTLYDAIAFVVNEATVKARQTGVRRRIEVCPCTPHGAAHLVVKTADAPFIEAFL